MKTPFKYIIYLLLISVFTCKNKTTEDVKQTEITFKKDGELKIISGDTLKSNLDIEFADTEYKTETGLMYRNSMKPNQGMLFIFNDVKPRYFYMKNTRFPLDIIYIDEHLKIVSFQKNAQVFSEEALPSNVPAKYVLEVNAGLADKWQLSVNDVVTYTKTN